MFKMVWDGAIMQDGAPDAVPLGPDHAAQAAALAELTIRARSDLGRWNWVITSASSTVSGSSRWRGSGFTRGTCVKFSGVCTHPDYQGRGLARRLMFELIRRQTARGELPFLHVMRDNGRARAMYARMGFSEYRELVVQSRIAEVTQALGSFSERDNTIMRPYRRAACRCRW